LKTAIVIAATVFIAPRSKNAACHVRYVHTIRST
jgi:hypothetical protein